MILQALKEFYQRSVDSGLDIAAEGFQKQEIPFLIVVNRAGAFVGMHDTREGDGKKKYGRKFTVPKAVKKTSGIAANLLWDTPAYVVGRPKPDPKKDEKQLSDRAVEQRKSFVQRIKENFSTTEMDEGIAAVVAFLERGDFTGLFAHTLWLEAEASGANLTFQLEGDTCLVCERPSVLKILLRENIDVGEKITCLITGEQDVPMRLHTSIKGVWGAQTSGANIVSFNLPAFTSHGKDQGLNAPIGKKAEFAYTTALNTLLAKGSRQRVQVGDASTVFWAEKKNKLEDIFADIFGEPAKGESEQDYKSVIAMFRSPESGAKAELDPTTKFYILGLAPNAARIAVRFWYAGTVGGIADNIWQHFEDLEMVKGPKDWHTITLRSLLRSTALLEKDENVPPNLAGDTMKAILAGTPYPQTLLAAALRRCRAEREITYPRAALIKAVLSRNARYYKRIEKEVGMSLDTNYNNPGYLLGRLFAVLERAQEQASPGGINATIKDRFYGAASSTPVAVFAHLMKLKNHHVAKINNKGTAVNLEKLFQEIVDKLDSKEAFPGHLALDDQGRFAVGYYHQRQSFFTKKIDDNSKEA